MTEFVHLIGAEDVRAAANSITRSASDISSAAGSLDSTRDLLMRQLADAEGVFFAQLEGVLLKVDERLQRLERLVDRVERMKLAIEFDGPLRVRVPS